MKFVELILRKIIKIVATRRHILRLKCTKFDFGCGSAPDPAEGAYTVLPRPPSWILQGHTAKVREGGDERRGGRRREGRGGFSGNVAEEAFCLKSAPANDTARFIQYAEFSFIIGLRQRLWDKKYYEPKLSSRVFTSSL